jgi:hypothetical protein
VCITINQLVGGRVLSALAALMLHLDIYADIFDEDLDGVANHRTRRAKGIRTPY